jgi:hypothetical protein
VGCVREGQFSDMNGAPAAVGQQASQSPLTRRPPGTSTDRQPACDRRPSRSCIRDKAAATCGLLVSMRVGASGVGGRRGQPAAALPGGLNQVAPERRAAWSGGGGIGGGRIAREEDQHRCDIPRPRRGHVRAAARCRRPPSLTRHAAGVPRRSAAAQQGDGRGRDRPSPCGLGWPPAQIPASAASALGSWLGYERRIAGRARDV